MPNLEGSIFLSRSEDSDDDQNEHEDSSEQNLRKFPKRGKLTLHFKRQKYKKVPPC